MTTNGMIVLFCFSIDPTLGKIDYSTLSQQTLMELLIDKIENKNNICRCFENIHDISQWDGVAFNDANEVIEIEWTHVYQLIGALELKWLPHTLQRVYVSCSAVTSVIDLTALPEDLKVFTSTMKLTGKADLTRLPSKLEKLSICHSEIGGTVDLEKLPKYVFSFYINENKLFGSVSLTKLPKTLEILSVAMNQFSGTVDLTKLPANMKKLYLNDNSFEGWTDFSKIPPLESLNVSRTLLEGSVYAFSGRFLGISNSMVTHERN